MYEHYKKTTMITRQSCLPLFVLKRINKPSKWESEQTENWYFFWKTKLWSGWSNCKIFTTTYTTEEFVVSRPAGTEVSKESYSAMT